ncbi:MAG: alpha,alpha-phosphotrehalase [Spirochaetia bacterium]
MEKKWWKEAVIYQVYPRSFQDSNGDGVGDIPGIISRLDHLEKLGIDVLWLGPVYPSPNDDNGYDISDYLNIMEEFGTMADWENLLNESHSRGMKLVMDLVVNHSSDEHPWFIESRKSKDNSYRDFYFWKPPKPDGSEPSNWESCFGGPAWEYDEKTGEYYFHHFSKKQVDLNWENPNVRSEIWDIMRFWLDKGIDGFRMDVINHISKEPGFPDIPGEPGKIYPPENYIVDGPKVHDYLREMNTEVLSKYDVMALGECPGTTVEQASLYTDQKRNELDMVIHFELVEIDAGADGKWWVQPYTLPDMKRLITRWEDGLHGKGWNTWYMNNHDQPRMLSQFGDDKTYRKESAKLLATLMHTLEGTPFVYQGEEIGMTNAYFDDISQYRDVESLNMYKIFQERHGLSKEETIAKLQKKSRDNSRTPMQWTSEKNAGFTTGKPWIDINPNRAEINVESDYKDPDSIFHYYRKLIQLRKNYPVIVYGRYELLEEEHPRLYVYIRTLAETGEKLLVVLNYSAENESYKLPDPFQSAELLLSNYDRSGEEQNVSLEPYEARVYYLKK